MKKFLIPLLFSCSMTAGTPWKESIEYAIADGIVLAPFAGVFLSKFALSTTTWHHTNNALKNIDDSLAMVPVNNKITEILKNLKKTLNEGKTLIKMYYTGLAGLIIYDIKNELYIGKEKAHEHRKPAVRITLAALGAFTTKYLIAANKQISLINKLFTEDDSESINTETLESSLTALKHGRMLAINLLIAESALVSTTFFQYRYTRPKKN